MQWTHEQSPIIQSKASKILVRAFAGTGKTTTLIASSSKQFQANYNGGMSNPNNLQQIVSRAGASTTVFISDAQGLPIANILTLISSAG